MQSPPITSISINYLSPCIKKNQSGGASKGLEDMRHAKRGASGKLFPNLVRDVAHIHNLLFLTILKPKISGQKVNKFVGKLGFDSVHHVEAYGFLRGIWCLLRSNKNVNEPWILMENFNQVLYEHEKIGGAMANPHAIRGFVDCLG
ncbi:hypothetical protein RJT34_21780 [Clitoria ternatea]|uniref:Uncharacterized protein n=1 Tax=Clitoria ternatea TaxID=43366 RepID=A0AAN9P613_CLITE